MCIRDRHILYPPGTSMSSVRPCHNTRDFCEFCNTSIPVPETSRSSVRLLSYPYPESTNPTEHITLECSASHEVEKRKSSPRRLYTWYSQSEFRRKRMLDVKTRLLLYQGCSNQNPRWTPKPCISPCLDTIFGSDYYVNIPP